MRLELLRPLGRIDAQRGLDRLGARVDAAKVQIGRARRVADRRLHRAGASSAAVDDPLQDAHVLAVARPEEASLVALAEPIHHEDLRRVRHAPEHREPVREVRARVVADEREHRHRVATDASDRAGDRRGRLRAGGRAEVDAVRPIEGLERQRDGVGPAAAEEDRRDRHAARVLRVARQRRVVLHRRGEAAVRMGRGLLRAALPRLPAPIDEVAYPVRPCPPTRRPCPA